MIRFLSLIVIALFLFYWDGEAQNKPRIDQLGSIPVSALQGAGGSGKIVAVDNNGKVIFQSLPALNIKEEDITQWNNVASWLFSLNPNSENPFNILAPSNGQFLRYNSSSGKWENATINFLTENSNITFTASGDITGNTTGTTTLSPVFTIGTGKVNSDKILDASILNRDIAANAQISGTKIIPDFGSQDIYTTGTVNTTKGLFVGKDSGNSGVLSLYDLGTTNKIGISSPLSLNTAYRLVLPEDAPQLNDFLRISTIDETDPANPVGTLVWSGISSYSHPSGFSNQPATSLSGNKVISQVLVNTEGHITGITSRSLTATDIGALSEEVDGDVSNEIQTLSVASNKVTLSNEGGEFTIAGAGINTVSTSGSTITIEGKEADGEIANEVQSFNAANPTSSGANLVLSEAEGTGGGTVRLVGSGATTVNYTDSGTITISSSDNTGPYYSAGSGINIISGSISANDVSATNEAQTLSVTGTSTTEIDLSPVNTSGGGTVTLVGADPIEVAHSGNTITISSTQKDSIPDLQVVTDVGNTTTNAILINDMTVDGSAINDNIRVGVNTGQTSSSPNLAPVGERNIAIGTESMKSLSSSATDNIGLGYKSLTMAETGIRNVAIGSSAMGETGSSGDENIAIGYLSLFKNTANINVAIGPNTLENNVSGGANVAIANYALNQNVAGQYNIAIGDMSLHKSIGTGNTGVGTGTFYDLTSGGYNTAFGFEAAYNVSSNTELTAIGAYALHSNCTGGSNTAVGARALYSTSLGSLNTALGSSALAGNSSGANNIAIGANAASSGSPSNSVYLGANVISSGASNEIAIGADATGHGGHTINLNSLRDPTLYIGNDAAKDRVFYEPLYYNKVGAIGSVLTGQGVGVMPIWKAITLASADGSIIIDDSNKANMSWDLSAKKITINVGGKLTVSSSADGMTWTITDVDPDTDPTNEIQEFKIDPATGKITLSQTDGKSSITLPGLVDNGDGSYTLPCPCGQTTKGIIDSSEEYTSTEGQNVFVLKYVPSSTSVVKMYVNGVRISNSAYTIVDRKVNYIPESNGSNILVGGERIQFDYFYDAD